jgi:hypothetical protein
VCIAPSYKHHNTALVTTAPPVSSACRTAPPNGPQARYRGYFAPPRPEKNAVEGQRMTDAFLEERRAALQRYMQRLAAHPVIGRSEVGWDDTKTKSAGSCCPAA